ncbi:MAG: hypothetical protein ACRDAX_03885 [Propionibacteriaceae bacterium]
MPENDLNNDRVESTAAFSSAGEKLYLRRQWFALITANFGKASKILELE